MSKPIIGLVIVFLLFGVFYFIQQNQKELGGFIKPLSSVLSSQVECGGSISGDTTTLWSTGENLEKVILDNLGVGNIYLGFGTNNATNTSGLHLFPGSTTVSSITIVDPTLLAKGANCVVFETTSTLNIFKF